MTKVICPEPGSQLTVGSVTMPKGLTVGETMGWQEKRITELELSLSQAREERDRLAAAVRDIACSPWHHRREFDFWCEQHSIAIALAQHAAAIARKEGE